MTLRFQSLTNLAGKLPAAKSALTAFNWYKWGLVALLVASYSGGLIAYGYHKASVKCEKEKTALAEQRANAIVEEVKERVPEVQIREVESAKQRAEIAQLKEKLNEALAKKPENPACALTSDERDGFNDLFKKTRPTK